jgi:hypothetical protein
MEIERVHLQFLKNMLRIRPSTCTAALYAELGRFPIKLRIQVRMIKYWQRALELPSDHLVRHSYESLRELHNLGQSNWCTQLFQILKEIGLEDHWINQSLNDKDILILKEKLFNNYSNQCMTSVPQFPKLRTYRTFKTEFQLEPYLSLPFNPENTIALARFRISSHSLRIETGRHTHPKTPEEDRLCTFCSTNSIENEIHFLMECPFYSHDRSNFMLEILPHIPNLTDLNTNEQFVKIMSSKCPDVIKALGKFVHRSFENRTKYQQGRDTVGASSASGALGS